MTTRENVCVDDEEEEQTHVSSSDVLLTIGQFFQEHQLSQTLAALELETGVRFRAVSSRGELRDHILNGRWEQALGLLSPMRLAASHLTALYDQYVVDLCASGQQSLARELMQTTPALRDALRISKPLRHDALSLLSSPSHPFSPALAYPDGRSPAVIRSALAEAIDAVVAEAPPAILLSLLSDALRWRRSHPSSASSCAFPDNPDVPRVWKFLPRQFLIHPAADSASSSTSSSAASPHPSSPSLAVRLPPGSHCECGLFLPADAERFVSGSSDGLVEVWDLATGALAAEFAWQQPGGGQPVRHEGSAVVAMAMHPENELLATGAHSGELKVWHLRLGRCLRTFAAHTDSISSIVFHDNQAVTCSFDGTVGVHGLKSGHTLKIIQPQGAPAFLVGAQLLDAERLLSASSEGALSIHDLRTTGCVSSVSSPLRPLIALLPVPGRHDRFLLCSHRHFHVVDSLGKVFHRFEAPPAVEAVAGALSCNGNWVFMGTADGSLLVFSTLSETVHHTYQASSAHIIGIASHPTLPNRCAIFTKFGDLIFLR